MGKAARGIYIGVLAFSISLNALLLLGTSATAGRASTVGVVDVAKVTDYLKQSAEWRQMMTTVENQRSQLRAEMVRSTRLRYLDVDELAEVKDLQSKATPTRAERRRIEALEAKSNQVDQGFQRLATIERPSDAHRQRLSEIQQIRELKLHALKDKEQATARRLSQSESDLLEIGQRRAQRAAAEVARDRQFDLVVDRELVLFGGQDVTAELLARFPAK